VRLVLVVAAALIGGSGPSQIMGSGRPTTSITTFSFNAFPEKAAAPTGDIRYMPR